MNLVIVTCPVNEIDKIAEGILTEKLAACVNIISKISSIYWWEDKINKDEEAILFIKTKSAIIPALINKIKEIHSYQVPEIIVLNITDGNPDYFKWIESVVK